MGRKFPGRYCVAICSVFVIDVIENGDEFTEPVILLFVH